MGDNVNLGSRLEGTNKEYGTNIIISEFTYAQVKGHVVARELGSVRVKGKKRPVGIYELRAMGTAPEPEAKAIAAFERALVAYRARDWDEAERCFSQVLERWPDDGPTGHYLEDIAAKRANPPPEGWDPAAPFHFVNGVEAAVAKAQEIAGDRLVEVAAGDVGGQVLAAGLVDEVRMDVVPVVFGSSKRYFGSVDAQHLLEDPDVMIQGNRVLHLRYRVRR